MEKDYAYVSNCKTKNEHTMQGKKHKTCETWMCKHNMVWKYDDNFKEGLVKYIQGEK